jgi:pimeloyl-ACP methyl ester carboxylesterase
MHLPTLFMTALALVPTTLGLSNFDDWAHERVQIPSEKISLHFRYHGTGPPILLVHGYPQHSLMWHTIGPLLAQNYTVIAPDNRGMGNSALSLTNNYTAAAGGADLKAILDYLNITKTHVFAHDKGVGLAASLAIEHPEVVETLVLAEYPLPGFGYSTDAVHSRNPYANWHLSFFAVPDVAEFLIRGREREMLSWTFWHASYSGTAAVPAGHLTRYTDEISKPGFLRSGFEYYASVWEEEAYFTRAFANGRKLEMPTLLLGGEASGAPEDAMKNLFANITANAVADVIPKAGHWIGEENPEWTAKRVLKHFSQSKGIPSADLSFLNDRRSSLGVFGGY